ncbi:citrulline utilization hydrolase CtlX [Solitalea lacus]|uniref:citrulline utilization hydrolase CtlX n=1 Tax=Solitalea lacus TaxID=2911172 RepID=UPI001EDB6DC9|nr:arginine deiminase-related protein [Solitalea lacus]UKJ05825.1 arginine deiminase-related protein [Solitalea lacus]
MQTTNHILMIRPVRFGFNAETAVNNSFQNPHAQAANTQEQAQQEFDNFVHVLEENGVDVTVVEDTDTPHTPDSIFPNNWISFHNDGNICLYPMQAENRRLERRKDIPELLKLKGFEVNNIIDFSDYEKQEKFLEGTGSMVLDRIDRVAYACLSPRTDMTVLEEFCKKMDYEFIAFDAVDKAGKAIYHTNVMMCIGTDYAVICLDSIPNADERETVANSLNASGKEIIEITLEQMNEFAGNMLELKNNKGESLLVMSEQAYKSLATSQVEKLSEHSKIIYAPIYTIEANGGGSARCMIAEVHLPL